MSAAASAAAEATAAAATVASAMTPESEPEAPLPSHTVSAWSDADRAKYLTVYKKQRANDLTIKNGDTVIIESKCGDARQFHTVCATVHPGKKERMVDLHNGSVSGKSLIGHPYGATFSYDTGSFVRVEDVSGAMTVHTDRDTEIVNTNETLVDDHSAQSLSYQQIKKMKKSKTGAELIDIVVQNSATFASKSKFSQEKYLNRKKKKYLKEIVVVRPTLDTLCETMYVHNDSETSKIMRMRADTLSLILTHANVGAGRDVAVVDDTGGIVLAGVIARTGGYGRTLVGYEAKRLGKQHRAPQCVTKMNFSHAQLASVHAFSLSWLKPSLVGTSVKDATVPASSIELKPLPTAAQQAAARTAAAETTAAEAAAAPTVLSHNEIRAANARTLLGRHRVDALIIVSLFSPSKMLPNMLPLLAPGCPFVVYHRSREPLAEAMHTLTKRTDVTGMFLRTAWYREHQVLPLRTHPHMTIDATGGYMLCGYKQESSTASSRPGSWGLVSAAPTSASTTSRSSTGRAGGRGGGRGGKRKYSNKGRGGGGGSKKRG